MTERRGTMQTANGLVVFNKGLDLIAWAADYHHMSVARLLQRDRTRSYAHIRFGLWWVMRADFGYSIKRLAREFLLKDHTSIIHGTRRAVELYNEDPAFAAYVNAMRAYIWKREAA